MADYVIVAVCNSCMMHSVNGECGDCHTEPEHADGEPLSRLEPGEFLTFDLDSMDLGSSYYWCETCDSKTSGDRFLGTLWLV